MNKKLIIKALIIAALAVPVLFFAVKAGPFDVLDLIVVMKFAIISAAAVYTWNYERNRKQVSQGLQGQVLSILWKLFILVAAVILLKRGFDLYRLTNMMKALFYFVPGILGVFWFFYMASGRSEYEIRPYENTVKKGNDWLLLTVKFLIAAALGALGVFFLHIRNWVVADIAFIGAFLQLALVFRKNTAAAAAEEAPEGGQELKLHEKLISLAMVAASLFLYYLTLLAVKGYDFKTAFVFFIMGSTLFGLAPGKIEPAKTDDGKLKLFDYAYLVFIFAAAIRIFTWDLSGVPPGLHGDESLFILLGKNIMNGIKYDIFIPAEEINSSTLNYWVLALMGRFTGLNVLTARLFFIVNTAIMICCSYLFFKELYNRRAAVISTVLMSTFFMTLLYSRIAISWMTIPMMGAASYYLFYKALKKSDLLLFVMSGALLGIGMYFYNAGKILPFFVPMYAVLALLVKDGRSKFIANWRGLLLLFAAIFIAYLPMTAYTVSHANVAFGRVAKVSIIKHLPPTLNEITVIAGHVVRNIQMFFTLSANGYCHNLPQKPFYDFLTGFWAIAGAGFLAFNWRKSSSLLVIAWLIVGLMPGFLSSLGPEDPFPVRMVLAIPVLMLMIALGVERVMAKLEKLWPGIFRMISPLIFLYVLAVFIFYNFNNFFVMYKNDPHTIVYYRHPEQLIADKMSKGASTTIFRMTPWYWENYYFGRDTYVSSPYLEKSLDRADVSVLQLAPLYNALKRDYCVIGEGLYYKSMPIYREYYPDTKIEIEWDRNFWRYDTTSDIKYCYEWKNPDAVIGLNREYHWFLFWDPKVPFVSTVFARIPYKNIEALAAIEAEEYSGAKLLKKSIVTAGSSVAFNGTFDRAVISGLIEIPDYQKYEFQAENGSGEIYLDGKAIKGPQLLYAGLHRIKFVIKKSGTGAVNLRWKSEKASEFSLIPAGVLLNSNKVFGLVAQYRSVEGRLLHESLEHDIQQRMYWPVTRPIFVKNDRRNDYNVKWAGYISVPESGNYEFRFETAYTAKVAIEGRTVYEKPDLKDKAEKITGVYLSKGRKPITINAYYSYTDKYWYDTAVMRFLYRADKNRQFGPVTYDMLSPY